MTKHCSLIKQHLFLLAGLMSVFRTLNVLPAFSFQGSPLISKSYAVAITDHTIRTTQHASLFIRGFQRVGSQCHFLPLLQILAALKHVLEAGRFSSDTSYILKCNQWTREHNLHRRGCMPCMYPYTVAHDVTSFVIYLFTMH